MKNGHGMPCRTVRTHSYNRRDEKAQPVCRFFLQSRRKAFPDHQLGDSDGGRRPPTGIASPTSSPPNRDVANVNLAP